MLALVNVLQQDAMLGDWIFILKIESTKTNPSIEIQQMCSIPRNPKVESMGK
jgi:hypothetical protein